MRNKLMTLCALVVCVPALAFAQQGGGGQGGGNGAGGNVGGGSQSGGQGAATSGGGAAMNTPRTKQERQRDSVILQQRAVQGDTGQGDQQGYHGTQPLTTPPNEKMGTRSDTGSANAAQGDTGTANAQGQQGQAQQGQSQQGKDTITSSAAGAIAPTGNQGLRKRDVKKLQTALDSLGCNAGPKDGIIGPKTQQAISCGEQKTNASNLQELGQKLNVNLSGNAGASAADTTGAGAVNPNKPQQTSGQNAGRIRPVPTTSDTGQKSQSDTLQQGQQGQQGQQSGVDTTTSKGAIDTSFNRSDTTQMNRSDTTQMNRGDTSQMQQRDTTQMNRTDTTGAGLRDTLRDTTTGTQRDTTMLRDTTRMRDTTMLRDTTRMRDTSTTRMF